MDSPATPEIELFYWPTPNGWKISILLEELKIPYLLRQVDIRKGEQFSKEFLSISPNNKIPAIIDLRPSDGGSPFPVFESGAILYYLSEKYGRLLPSSPRKRHEVMQWVFWQVSSVGPIAGQVHHFREYASERIPYAIERFTKEINRLYGILDTRLGRTGRYVAGDEYSIADITCWVWCRLWRHHGQDLGQFPHLERWLLHVGKRPAVQRGFRIGNEWREGRSSMTDEARAVLLGQMARPDPS